MLESPVLPCWPPGQTASSRCNRGYGQPSVPAIDSRCPAPGPRPSRVNDPGSCRVPAVDSRPRAPRPLIRVDDQGSDRDSSVDSRPPAPRPRPAINSPRHAPPPRPIDDPGSCRLPLRLVDARRPPAPRPIDDSGRLPLRPIDARRLPLRPIDARRPPAPRPIDDSGRIPLLPVDARRPPSPRPIDDSGRLPLQPVDARRPPAPRPNDDSGRLPLRPAPPAPRPRPSTLDLRRHEPPARPNDDPRSGCLPLRAIHSRRSAPRLRTSIQAGHPGSGHDHAIHPRRPRPPAARPSFGVSSSCKTSAAAAPANKELEEANNEIQRLNELCLGDDISYEDYCGFLEQFPGKIDCDTSTKLDDVQLKENSTRHKLYYDKYYKVSQVREDKLYEEDGQYLRASPVANLLPVCSNHGGAAQLDWFFHPDYCKLAGLEDYQRLVPRNYGGYEYVAWDEYHKYFHSYEIEQEYIKYCEELSKELKWMEAYVPNKSSSLKWGRILTRGTYQAIKIATGFTKITGDLAFSGFYEWFDSMSFDVCSYKELDGVYYQIWQRYTNEKKFRDALDEVHELNRFPLRQDRMRSALDNDTFCSDLEEEFLACTTCLKKFAEDKTQISEEKARELIAEALRKETQKPKFYEEYCRRKIEIAEAIGLISS